MTDIVLISLERWDGVWRRNQHLISRILTADPTLRVLFVEPPADPLHDLLNGRAVQYGARERVQDDVSSRLWTLRPTKPLPRRLAPHTDRQIARRIAYAAKRLGMANPVLWINDPAAATMMRFTGWSTLYDMTDDWAAAERPPHEHRRIERGDHLLLDEAVAVVACSPELVRRKSAVRGPGRAPVALIRNAVDAAGYSRATERPTDLPGGRVALYAGTLHSDRLDVELCCATVEQLAGRATVTFVGPDLLSESDRRRLVDKGAVILGARPHEAVPAYLMHSDVLLVPHRVDAFTDSLDPLKFYEYQAARRPVVTTAVAGFRDADDPRFAVVDATEFPIAVESAMGTAFEPAISTIEDWSDRARAMSLIVDAVANATTDESRPARRQRGNLR